jgi:hypothetical protein
MAPENEFRVRVQGDLNFQPSLEKIIFRFSEKCAYIRTS